jgi:hypothetical protein
VISCLMLNCKHTGLHRFKPVLLQHLLYKQLLFFFVSQITNVSRLLSCSQTSTPNPMPTTAPPTAHDCSIAQSALAFRPRQLLDIVVDEPFVVGTLIHYNCPIYGASVKRAELTVCDVFWLLLFDKPNIFDARFLLNCRHS